MVITMTKKEPLKINMVLKMTVESNADDNANECSHLSIVVFRKQNLKSSTLEFYRKRKR